MSEEKCRNKGENRFSPRTQETLRMLHDTGYDNKGNLVSREWVVRNVRTVRVRRLRSRDRRIAGVPRKTRSDYVVYRYVE